MVNNYLTVKNGLIVQGPITASAAATTASWAISASWAPSGGGQVAQSTNATQSLFAVSASWASSSLSSSWITASSVFGTVANATNAGTANSAISASNLSGFSFGTITTTLTNTLTPLAVLTVSTSSYISAFFDYAAISSSNVRAGTVFGAWLTNGILTYTEMTNVDVGNTQDVTMSLGLGTGGTIQLSASSITFGNWSIRAQGRFI